MVASTGPRFLPSSSFLLFGTKANAAKNVAIYMDGQTIDAVEATKMNDGEETLSNCESAQRTLLSALLKNDFTMVQRMLLLGVDPNFAIYIGLVNGRGDLREGTVSRSGNTNEKDMNQEMMSLKEFCMDQVFSFKRILGDSPSLLHIAILNVYYRTTHGTGRYLVRQNNSEVERALSIFNLLLEFGANIHQPSFQPMLFHEAGTRANANTPLCLAETIYHNAFLYDTASISASAWEGTKNTNLRTTMGNIVQLCRQRDLRLQKEHKSLEVIQANVDIADERSIPQDSSSGSPSEVILGSEMAMVGVLEELTEVMFVNRKLGTSADCTYEALTLFCTNAVP